MFLEPCVTERLRLFCRGFKIIFMRVASGIVLRKGIKVIFSKKYKNWRKKLEDFYVSNKIQS